MNLSILNKYRKEFDIVMTFDSGDPSRYNLFKKFLVDGTASGEISHDRYVSDRITVQCLRWLWDRKREVVVTGVAKDALPLTLLKKVREELLIENIKTERA